MRRAWSVPSAANGPLDGTGASSIIARRTAGAARTQSGWAARRSAMPGFTRPGRAAAAGPTRRAGWRRATSGATRAAMSVGPTRRSAPSRPRRAAPADSGRTPASGARSSRRRGSRIDAGGPMGRRGAEKRPMPAAMRPPLGPGRRPWGGRGTREGSRVTPTPPSGGASRRTRSARWLMRHHRAPWVPRRPHLRPPPMSDRCGRSGCCRSRTRSTTPRPSCCR